MTDENEKVDKNHLSIARKVETLGRGWDFDRWEKQGDEWKNNVHYQIKVGYDYMLKHHSGLKFICIRTGAEELISQKKDEQKNQTAARDGIDIPVIYGVKGFPKRTAFFEFEITKEKTSEK